MTVRMVELLVPEGIELMMIHYNVEHGHRQADTVQGQELRAQIFTYKLETEKANWECCAVLKIQSAHLLQHAYIF